jgi:hypothetical protein
MGQVLEKIANFDLSNRQATYLLLAILSAYVLISVNEVFEDECTGLFSCHDYDRRMARLYVWDVNWFVDDFRHIVHFGLLVLSDNIFGNAKVLVLGSSVILLVVTYLFTYKITGKYFGSIIAVLIVMQSSVFYVYDVSVTYPTFWATLFITSLYLITTKSYYLSAIPFIISVPAKGITALFWPSIIIFIMLAHIPKHVKVRSLIIYAVIGIVSLGLVLSITVLSDKYSGGFLVFNKFDPMKFASGFISWTWKGFADDQSTLLILFITTGFLWFNRKKIPNANAMLGLIFSMIFISPILTGMTTYDVWPYRMLPVVVIVAVNTGLIISHLSKIDFSMFLPAKKVSSK